MIKEDLKENVMINLKENALKHTKWEAGVKIIEQEMG